MRDATREMIREICAPPVHMYIHVELLQPTKKERERAGETEDDINSGGRYRVWAYGVLEE